MPWSQPSTDRIREVLRLCAPQLAHEPIAFLAEGWEFWAYIAGDHVLRFPKADRGFVWKLGDQSSADSLRIERALTPELAPRLSTVDSSNGRLLRLRPQRGAVRRASLPPRRNRHVRVA